MKYIILDETCGHVVNESEAYAEAEEIVDRLVKETGHKSTIRSA